MPLVTLKILEYCHERTGGCLRPAGYSFLSLMHPFNLLVWERSFQDLCHTPRRLDYSLKEIIHTSKNNNIYFSTRDQNIQFTHMLTYSNILWGHLSSPKNHFQLWTALIRTSVQPRRDQRLASTYFGPLMVLTGVCSRAFVTTLR